MEGSLPGSEEGVPVEEVPDVCDADSGRPRDWQQVLAVAGQHTFKKLFREAFKIIHRLFWYVHIDNGLGGLG